LQALLSESPTPLTRRELLERWPGDAPHIDSLLRTLARGIELGLFTGAGKGTKVEPFRFTVVRRAEVVDPDFRAEWAEKK
jgi:flagellar biosynthesis/type III secretory pathway ATPase